MPETCDVCKQVVELGSWPWCPHERGSNAIEPDDVPGGFVVENGFPEEVRFYSHSAHRAALAARGLEIRAKYAGEHDKHLKRWDAPTAKSLEDARVLLERGTQARDARREHRASLDAAKAAFPITVRTMDPSEVGR